MASSYYVGRFAPTPSGPLHFGTVVAALGSFLDARKNHGRWLVRFDDLDTPRVKPGSADAIIKALDILGLHWDGDICYQSTRQAAYQAALDILAARQLVYSCSCPRKLVKGRPYPGTCRARHHKIAPDLALRLITGDGDTRLVDRIQGEIIRNLGQTTGDFIVRRSDNFVAYHLATVIDDGWQKVTDIVRGGDLLEATPCQTYLQSCLDLPGPAYCHLPVAVDRNGNKISKSRLDRDVLHGYPPSKLLLQALRFLGHDPGPDIDSGSVDEIIQWGIDNWQITDIPRQKKIRSPIG